MKSWLRPLRDIVLVALMLFGLSFLPSDTSLSERKQQGVLRFCIADARSALITTETGAPGPEARMMAQVAADLGLRLQLVPNANMGRSFNPSDWHISRGQCDVLGGGLANSAVNRGFLTMLPNGGQLALQLYATQPPGEGAVIGVYLGHAGFDRVRLSSWLRANGWRAKPLANAAALRAWVASGQPAIASSLIALPESPSAEILPQSAAIATELAFGLWRGDMTLTKAVRNSLRRQAEAGAL